MYMHVMVYICVVGAEEFQENAFRRRPLKKAFRIWFRY